MELLEGTVRRITFRNNENFYSVFRLDLAGSRFPATVVGFFPALKEGEQLRLEGEWITHPTFGRQFKTEKSEVILPTTENGLIRYLGSGLLKGIKQKRAEAMVQQFGQDILRVIRETPEALTAIRGIDKKMALRIRDELVSHKEIENFMVYLQGFEISPHLAMRIYKHYQNQGTGDMVNLIRSNPYRLADEVFGIGFRTADDIGQKLGISAEDPQRLKAGVRYVLSEQTNDGHCYVPKSLILEQASNFLQAKPELLEHALLELLHSGDCIGEVAPSGEERVYLAPFFYAESRAAQRLQWLIASGGSQQTLTGEEAWQEQYRLHIAPLEVNLGIHFAKEQIQALQQALMNNVTVITGGPGTGKTTIVRALTLLYQRQQAKILLAAPTGRAAKRLSEVTGREAKTIHRLLEYSFVAGVGVDFARNEDNPLSCDLLIVDESSMIDILLFYHLLKALPPGCRLILIGDQDQLPSVGPGNVLKDLIESQCLPVVRLKTVFRQAEQSLIVTNAHRIHGGEMPQYGQPDGDFFFMEKDDGEEVLQLVCDLAAQRLPSFLQVDPWDGIQVLTPMKRGSVGVDQLNHSLQQRLNPAAANKPELMRAGVAYRLGDKVMQIRNNYDKGVFNGDIGRVVEVDREVSSLTVEYIDGEGSHFVAYEDNELDELVQSYAITVHKSQGSEYPAVIIPLLTQHAIMLQRNLLYTAVTRGKKLVVIVGSKKALRLAIQRNDVTVRFTALAERLRGGTHPLA